eukprot:768438-Hanusia_phi.AAC.8
MAGLMHPPATACCTIFVSGGARVSGRRRREEMTGAAAEAARLHLHPLPRAGRLSREPTRAPMLALTRRGRS